MKYSITLTEASATDPKVGWNWYVTLEGKTLALGHETVRGAAETAAAWR